MQDVTAACVFNSPAFPDSLLVSRDNNIVIGQLDTLHELQTRTACVLLLLILVPALTDFPPIVVLRSCTVSRTQSESHTIP